MKKTETLLKHPVLQQVGIYYISIKFAKQNLKKLISFYSQIVIRQYE